MTIDEILAIDKVGNSHILKPYGNTEAKLMLVLSHPSFRDLDNQRILSGEDLSEVQAALKEAGLAMDDVWITSVVKCGIGKRVKPMVKQVNEHRHIFDAEVQAIKPKLIMALGAEAWKYVLGSNWKSSDWTGEIIDSPQGKLIGNFSPYNIHSVDPLSRDLFRQYFKYAKQFINDELNFDTWTYEVVDTVERNTEIIEHYLNSGKRLVAFDMEWEVGHDHREDVLSELQYAMSPNHAIVLDLSKDGGKVDKELLNSMKLLFERDDIDICGHNAKGDLKKLKYNGFDIQDRSLYFDTMLAINMMDSTKKKGLEHVIWKHTNLPHYYVDMFVKLKKNKLKPKDMVKMKFIDRDLWDTYASGDAIAHYQGCVNMKKVFDETMPESVKDYFYNVYQPMSWYLLEMEIFGLPVDVSVMDRMHDQYHRMFEMLNEKMIGYAKLKGIDNYRFNYFGDVNELFFDKLKLPPGWYTKKTKGKSRFWYEDALKKQQVGYKPSTNSKGLGIMYQDLKAAVEHDPDNMDFREKFEILKTQYELSKMNAITNKFLSKKGTDFVVDGADDYIDYAEGEEPLKTSYYGALGRDNRIYPDYYGALENYRVSSKPNVQVAPSKALGGVAMTFKAYNEEPPAHIRNIFWAGHRDYVFLEADLMSADVKICADLSKDKLLDSVLKEKSFHVEQAKKYFDDETITKEKDPTLIVNSKMLSFNSLYSSSFRSASFAIQATIYGETGKYFTVKFIEEALTRGWGQYKEYTKYKKYCEDQMREYGYIDNAYGMRYHLGKSDNPSIQAGYVNKALAWPIASVMSLSTHAIAMNIRRHLISENLWMRYIFPCCYIHDALMFVLHKDLLMDNYIQNVVCNYFSRLTPTVTGDYVGVDYSIATHWKGDTISEGKTKWNKEKQEWYW